MVVAFYAPLAYWFIKRPADGIDRGPEPPSA
jgi:hypothetical protein